MKRPLFSISLLPALLLTGAGGAAAHELSGYVSAEARLFPSAPLHPVQERHNASVAFQPEYYHEWENGSSVTVTLFGRLDSADGERSHFDIRELNYLWLSDGWELRLGIGKVFWGVTEFEHLVDIINQDDGVENIDGEDKLGQPMVNLSLPRDWGTLDLFVLPRFRERTFPGRAGRLRSSPVVDTDGAIYESDDEERHIDFAARYSHTLGNWDFGLYHFKGTGREPTLLPEAGASGGPVLIPFYEQIDQTGLDVQSVAGDWLLKLEAIHRTGQGEAFLAAVSGFEYTLVNVGSTGMDLGLIGEYGWDERGKEATTAFQNDLMLGLRWELNDAASTRLLFGFLQDLEGSSRSLSVEGSRRFGDNWVLSLEGRTFFGASEGDFAYFLREDDFIRTEVAYHF